MSYLTRILQTQSVTSAEILVSDCYLFLEGGRTLALAPDLYLRLLKNVAAHSRTCKHSVAYIMLT